MSLLTSAATMMRLDDARLPDILRDEIKARTFFLLCNTRASRRSKWVKQEMELVKQVTKRPRQTVVVMNLARDLPTETEVGRERTQRSQSKAADLELRMATMFLRAEINPSTPDFALFVFFCGHSILGFGLPTELPKLDRFSKRPPFLRRGHGGATSFPSWLFADHAAHSRQRRSFGARLTVHLTSKALLRIVRA